MLAVLEFLCLSVSSTEAQDPGRIFFTGKDICKIVRFHGYIAGALISLFTGYMAISLILKAYIANL